MKFPETLSELFKLLKRYGIYGSLAWVSYKAYWNFTLFNETNIRLQEVQNKVEIYKDAKSLAENNLKSIIYNIAVASGDFDDLKLPLWYKIYDREKDEFRMVYLNQEYESRFNVDKVEYLGKRDFEVNPGDVSKEYEKNDRKAYWSRVPIFVDEKTPGGVPIRVVKWRVDKGGESFIYGIIVSE